MKLFIICLVLLLLSLLNSSWGFFAHMRINQLAVLTLPGGISRFYKANSSYLTEHATDADKRRYADTAEAPRHYLDVELYHKEIDSIPRKWEDAVKKYGLQTLYKNGILPWQIQRTYYKLVNAFKERDSIRILIHSAYLGHYIGDAHVPLHTTANHNGQLTNQVGIHAFWESRLPEMFSTQYNFLVGRAHYIDNPLTAAWVIVKHTHNLVDSTLKLEAQLNKEFPSYRKYSYSKRKGVVVKQYAAAYAKAYHDQMQGMVEKQMRSAILAIGCFWFSAWVDAGQPTLENLLKTKPDPADRVIDSVQNQRFKTGNIIRAEN